MTLAADNLATTRNITAASPQRWRETADAFAAAVRAHEAAFDGEAAINAAFESARPLFPQILRDALYLGSWSVPVGIDCLDAKRLEGLLSERRYLDCEVASLLRIYIVWREATLRVKAAVGLEAKWNSIRTAADTRGCAFATLLETPAPDLKALAEKIALAADEFGWEDDPRARQVAILARDAHRLCDQP